MSDNRIEEIKKRIKQVEHLQNKTSERTLIEMDIPWMIARILELEAENKALKVMVPTGPAG